MRPVVAVSWPAISKPSSRTACGGLMDWGAVLIKSGQYRVHVFVEEIDVLSDQVCVVLKEDAD